MPGPRRPLRRSAPPRPIAVRQLIVEVASEVDHSGLAAFGALVREALTGRVLSQVRQGMLGTDAAGVQLSGLIAGLELALAIDPAADLEVRTDSADIINIFAGPDGTPRAGLGGSLPGGPIRWALVSQQENQTAWLLVGEALSLSTRRGLVDA